MAVLPWVAGLPLVLLFVGAGVGHFADAPKFVGIMKGLPFASLHPAANYATGVAEMVLGAALTPIVTNSMASRAANLLFCLVLIMTPANINMIVNDVPFGSHRLTNAQHTARMLVQVLLLCYLRWLGRCHLATPDEKQS